MGYLEEEWTLAFSLRAGRPEPVRKTVGLCCGDVVAQCQRLLLQLLWGAVPGQQALPLALNPEEEEDVEEEDKAEAKHLQRQYECGGAI